MPWHALWPDFLKKRLCRYLLQHYLGHFFKEKISLEQLSIDIYNGTGCVKNLNLDCEALNEQLNEASDSTTPCSNLRHDKTSTVPVEIVSGFVGYISVYIPWHDLFNDFCKLTIKNVQITIRVKQRKPSMFDTGEANIYDDDIEMDSDGSSGTNSMFSSMFVDSLMNTSMHIAQECLNENSTDPSLNKKTRFKSGDSETKSKNSDSEAFDDESIKIESSGGAKKDSLLGLEAFASTIDSILSRIKINLENIQIRVENIDTVSHFKFNEENIMSSSTMFSNKPSNGIALELRIKAIKYFDLDSTIQQPHKPTDTASHNQQHAQASTSHNLGNTTKSFNIEGLTVYFDEFIIKDEIESESRTSFSDTTFNSMSNVENETVNDQSTSSTDETVSDSMRTSFSKPNDEAPPFNYELNPDIYLYTNPIIFVTFTGIQSIKLTINNMRPTDMIEAAAATTSESMTKSMILSQSQRPLMELSAQFGSIKSLLCPKQIHLLIDMVTKLTDYIDAANSIKKSKSMHRNSIRSSSSKALHQRGGFQKSVRGCDKRQYEALIHNNLVQDSANLDILLNDDENIDDEFKSPVTTDNEQSVMFYSMMSESTAFSNVNSSHINLGNLSNSPESTYMMDESHIEGSESQTDPNKTINADEEEDKLQQKFVNELKETIEQLQTDIIVANSAKVSLNKSTTQHNLFQTFKVTFRMFSLTVLHHDPPPNSESNSQSKASSFPGENSSTKRMLVDRMKALSDNYFDWVSTIDATNLTSMNSNSIDKQMLMKYHQALAFNDHFLILMKPINMSLNQRINQRYLNGTKRQSQLIQYSLNEVALTIGYIHLNEYLVAVKPQLINKNPVKEAPSLTRRAKSAKVIEASQAATITELVSFSDNQQSSQLALEQPCFKLQVVVYEPLELINTLSRTRQTFPNTSRLGTSANIQNQLLNRHFENITINLNQSLACELDISILDRLYYLINDISKYTSGANEFNKARSRRSSNFNENLNNDTMACNKKFQNFEIKCSQVMKLALRFPIADLRRAPSQNTPQQTKKPSKPNNSNSSSTTVIPPPPPNSKNLTFLAQPATMSAFRQLREQILTLHIFEFSFQTLLNQKPAKEVCSSLVNPDQLNLIITCSQINAYYQYSKKERPIHFGLIQQRLNEPRSLIVSIRIPIEMQEHASDLNELYKEYYQTNTQIDQDSLKVNYNINVGKANRFNNPTIIEESDENNSDNETAEDLTANEKSKKWRKTNDHDHDEDSDDDDTCGPFSRIHSLISSEKNRRIVNAGNKQEMQAFIQQSKQNSQSVIQLNLPNLKLLVADQKFLNDIYNCFLNDLIMWLPSPVPPIESALNLFYDVQNNPNIFTTELSSNMTSPIQSLTNLNYLIDYNFDTDFIATRMNFANNTTVSSSEDEALDADRKKFHMCRSEVIKPKSESSDDSGSCESDDDALRRKSKKKISEKYKKKESIKSKSKDFKNTISVIVNIEKAHLKAFVINKPENPTNPSSSDFTKENKEENALKYGEFDIKTDKFHMCIAISESLKEDLSNLSQKKSSPSSSKNHFKIEKQHISIYTDEINIAHSTKKCENNVQQLKYPTNFASFENLFQMSKTNNLITLNDPSIEQSLFNSTGDAATGSTMPNSTYTAKSSGVVVPMVSIGIKSKFNTKLNKKQLLVALNFKNLSLHHLFCSQPDYWIFQLIELFNLIDIDIVGYEVPIVLTELHLNVENSCVLYKPLYLPSRALVAFKSLHWSSNVTAESTLTLLVFNIEDIYLFISKMAETSDGDATSINFDGSSGINLKRDYICIANSDLFELRLLINDEDKVNQQREDIVSGTASSQKQEKTEEPSSKLKSPLLDIKIRSNLIQLRTCVDSAFALIELINYIVSDGDLHQPNQIMSEFMSSNPQAISIPKASSKIVLEQQTSQTLVDEMISAINHEQPTENSSDNLAINIGNPTSSSIPIQKSTKAAQFIVGTPPTQSFSFKSASSSFNQQIFYSPQKSQASMSPASVSTAASSLQDRRLMMAPISQPSLSFNFKNPNNLSNMSLGPAAGGSSVALGAGTSSSAESLISDMVKEAMTSNPMMQSVYGSLNSSPSHVKNEFDEPKIVRKRYTSLTLPSKSDYLESTALKTVKETSIRKTETNEEEEEEDSENDVYKTDEDISDENNLSLNMSKNMSIIKSRSSPVSDRSRSSSSSSSSRSSSDDEKINSKLSESVSDEDEDENLIASIHMHNSEKLKSSIEENHSDSESELNKNRSYQDDNEDFQFSLPFSGISPSVSNRNTSNMINSCSSENMDRSMTSNRQLMNDNNSRRLQFKPEKVDSDEDDDDLGIGYEYNRRNFEDQYDDNKSSENEEDLLRDFDVIEVIPGFGEAPKNNKEFDVKILSTNRNEFTVRDEHFKKPLTKVDVLKAPEAYPVPLNIYCVQEISINWCMYGGNDFLIQGSDANDSKISVSPQQQQQVAPVANQLLANRINRAVSNPIIVGQQSTITRSRHSSTSSNALSLSPQQFFSMQSPEKTTGTSPSSGSIKFSSKNTSVSFSAKSSSASSNSATTENKYYPRKAGGRIKSKYDHQNLNWMARGGRQRNLDVCMEIALHKVKTKIDLYADLTKLDTDEVKEDSQNESPLLYRVALAIGDIEIRDKLASSPFNMFLFRYESDHCPKHTNSNMFFLKFLCSKSMDAQRLLECDIKVSIQPLRFNIDQDALIFLVEFFTKMASKDLNEFSKSLLPPPPPPQIPVDALESTLNNNSTQSQPSQQTHLQTPQQVFIRNFIFSPDLLVRFDFSGKYDGKSETKMDTLTKLLMFAIQLSNTEIKLKRICYRRGFLGAEKLFQALVKEWLTDIQRNQMKNLIKGWGIFNSLIQFFEGFTYLIWYPIEQYRKDGRVLCGIQKGSAAFSTCTVLATIELTNRMFQATKNIAEFFYDLVTPHRANSMYCHNLSSYSSSNNVLVETILTGVGNNRNIRLRRHPNDIREGLTNAYYVMYEGMNDTANYLMQEINQGAEHKGIPGAIGGVLRQLPSTALAPIVLTTEATCNILSGIRNQLKPDEKRDDDQKWKTIAPNS